MTTIATGRQQPTVMRYDPATGVPNPMPKNAAKWREWHGYSTAWLFNPWTGQRRTAEDVGSDTQGQLIVPSGEPLFADTKSNKENV